MKKSLLAFAAMLVSGTAFAATDHYLLSDGNHVQHLKITKINDKITVSIDVDFEPNANETGAKFCSSEITGDARMDEEGVLFMKKHSGIEANYCKLKIYLTPSSAPITAKIEQSKNCDNFVTGICHFSTNGKELVKVK